MKAATVLVVLSTIACAGPNYGVGSKATQLKEWDLVFDMTTVDVKENTAAKLTAEMKGDGVEHHMVFLMLVQPDDTLDELMNRSRAGDVKDGSTLTDATPTKFLGVDARSYELSRVDPGGYHWSSSATVVAARVGKCSMLLLMSSTADGVDPPREKPRTTMLEMRDQVLGHLRTMSGSAWNPERCR